MKTSNKELEVGDIITIDGREGIVLKAYTTSLTVKLKHSEITIDGFKNDCDLESLGIKFVRNFFD